LEPPQRSPIHLLHRAGQCAGEIFRAEVQRSELTPRQLAILISIAQNDGENQTVLSERTGVDRSTLADVIRRLQKRGLLQRRRTKNDARAYSVRLTDAGRQLLQKVEPLARQVDQRLLKALPDRRRQQFLDALQSVIATLQQGTMG
jgi:MarR family transcriptional regulator, temperature-dependent positive regulator of motility